MWRRLIMSDALEKTSSPISKILFLLKCNDINSWSSSNNPSCNVCILFWEADRTVRCLRWGKQSSGSWMSWLLSRYKCVSVVSRQTERGTCVRGVLMMRSDVSWPYVKLLDNSESNCTVSCSRLTSWRPWQSIVKLLLRSLLHWHLEGQFSSKLSTAITTSVNDNNSTHCKKLQWSCDLQLSIVNDWRPWVYKMQSLQFFAVTSCILI